MKIFESIADGWNMKSKVQEFEIPGDKEIFVVQVREDGSWTGYYRKAHGLDYSNPVLHLEEVPLMLQASVKLYIDKCMSDFGANKAS